MAFDLDNAVQQGFNRDVDTNDWHVEARDLEIQLGDHGGVREFRILDDQNVGVVVADSDGYLAIAGNAEVRGGHVLVRGESLVNTPYITLQDQIDEISVYMFDLNPDGTISGEEGSFGTNRNDGYMYVNVDGAVKWERLAMVSQIPNFENNTVTLQQAYDNDVDGGDATIVTNVTDGNIVFTGTQDFVVTTTDVSMDVTGAISLDSNLDSNFTVDGANLTLSTENSGDVIVSLPSPGGDFVVDQGVGEEYIRAETSANELRLGDLSPTQIDVRVLSDMVVDGDLTVNGTTTTVNTEDLFVEDRLIRLNIGAAPSFSGTTGIEMEVGSDGYVEFHWNDANSCWEVSIDRSTTPEAQTFRPLSYLAASPATKDLSSIGTDGFPTAGPNPDAGASVINTNDSNFPNTFGPLMTDDSVQAALEAIDAYFTDLSGIISEESTQVTLQIAYDNDVDGGDATIVTNATDGNIVFTGTEDFVVTTTDIDFDVTGAVSIDADAASNFTTSAGSLRIDGAGGVILDGNGSDVVPGATCVDSLGSASLGWTDIYLCNDLHGDIVVALDAEGSATAHNSTAGADLVGTNSDNFTATFGGDMVENTVQAALEAIDAYLQELTVGISVVTLQIAYKNDVDGGDAIITTDAIDGCVVIAGTECFRVTADGGFDLDSQFDADIDAGDSFDLDVTGGGGFHLDSYGGNSNVCVDSADLVLCTTTSGNVTVDGATGVILDGNGEGVRPASDCTDDLGRQDAGWKNIYLCDSDNNTICLIAEGDNDAHNNTSGSNLVGTNANNFSTFGPDMFDNTVQSALEAIDAYLQDLSVDDLVDTTFKRCVGLNLVGGVQNGNTKVSTDGSMPAIDYKSNATGRTMWTIPVPDDWDGASDIEVEVIWSAADSTAGDVLWRLEYLGRSLTELVDAAVITDDFTQAASGTANSLQSTGANLAVAAGDISITDDVIVINVVRRGAAAGDTYTKDAQVHLVKYCYNAENIVT